MSPSPADDAVRATLGPHACRIEHEFDGTFGTGVLVGPNVMLTNSHVLRVAETEYSTIALLFGAGADRRACPLARLLFRSEGTEFEMTADGSDDADATRLDFVLVETTGSPGRDVMSMTARRGWSPLMPAVDQLVTGDRLTILGHAAASEQLVARTATVLGIGGEGTRVFHDGETHGGSSGSPCYDDRMRLVALHNGSGGTGAFRGSGIKRAIPTVEILMCLQQHGLDGRVTGTP